MQVTLKNKQAFREILKDYHPGKESIEILSQIQLAILLGVSGSGRNTIIDHLVEMGTYKFIVSDTTRPPKVRNGILEQNGVEYYFRSEEEILRDLQDGKFLEAEVIHNQQVSGISIRELELAAASGKITINEVEIGGTDSIYEAKPDTYFFFIVPPSYKIWMERLAGRETMTEQELANRLQTARRVLQKGLKGDHFTFVINDSSLDSAKRIDQHIRGTHDIGHHEEALGVANKLLLEIEHHHGL